jgi:hypothetical protein
MSGRLARVLGLVAALVLGQSSRPALAQEELFVTNGTSVVVYARTANGDVAPVRTLAGAATGLNNTQGLAVDRVNDELVVVNAGNNSITVYPRTADGNVAPLRTLIGASTGLNFPFGMALDLQNNELVVANSSGHTVTVYARSADGDTAPLRTLAGAATGLSFPECVAVDTVHNELAVSGVGGGDSIRVFSRTANGDTAPLRTIVGAATGLDFTQGLVVDTVNDELVSVNRDSLAVHSRTANGNVPPLRNIVGPATGLCGAEGVAVDTANDELAVAHPNDCNTAVLVFARTANGNVAPIRKIAGVTTGLFIPSFPAITTDFQVATISPTSGPASGGTPVVITGNGFLGGATVSIGGVAATGVNVVGPTEIDASTPALPPGTLNAVTIANATLLSPSTVSIPSGWMADFLDVPQADIVHSYVEKVFRLAITVGCSGGNYCRNDPVKRKQMAVFLLKAKFGGSHVPPPALGTVFSDVPASDPFAPWIEELASLSITGGCGGGNYCPEDPVRRDQMAVFLLKAFEGSGYTPPACAGLFTDVACTPTPAFAVDWIEELYNRAVTGGCVASPLQYCPLSSVLRGQMAVFLVKTFGL